MKRILMLSAIMVLSISCLFAKKINVTYQYIGKGDYPPNNCIVTTGNDLIITSVEKNGKIINPITRKGDTICINKQNSTVKIDVNFNDKKLKVTNSRDSSTERIELNGESIQTSEYIYMTINGESSFSESKKIKKDHHVYYEYKKNTLNGSLYNFDYFGSKSHYYQMGEKIYVYSSERTSPDSQPEVWDLTGRTAVIELPVELHSSNMLVNVINRYILENIDRDLLQALYPFIFLQHPLIDEENKWSYESNSVLNEGGVVYNAQNLSTIKGLPWASGNGYGIGDKIIVNFNGEAPKTIFFLNGFISEEKPYLFVQNSRAKKMKLINPENNTEMIYTVYSGDNKEFSQIDISNLYKNNSSKTLIIEICDVFPGTKYKDLCIQAIIPDFSYMKF